MMEPDFYIPYGGGRLPMKVVSWDVTADSGPPRSVEMSVRAISVGAPIPDEPVNEIEDGIVYPCQPIGCDNGFHLPGCKLAPRPGTHINCPHDPIADPSFNEGTVCDG